MATSMIATDAASLRRRFDEAGGLTVGVEEELMLLDPATLDLAPRADELLRRLDGDVRFKAELPAAQIEIVTAPHPSAVAVIAELSAARRDLAHAAGEDIGLAVAGAHPFAADAGELNPAPRYDAIREEYGIVARRQLVTALQVHVAVGGADRSLAVYNALRSHLPEILALAANAPYQDGVDTGLATVRPGISVQLPRQGVPPLLSSWEELAGELAWGARAGPLADPSRWWWELRPHPLHGTLELRVPDAQTTVADAAGIVAFVQALCARLADQVDAGEFPAAPPTWRIAENRWSATRYGVEGTLADLCSGEPRPTRDRLTELVDEVAPYAERLGCADLLRNTRELVERNGAMRQREVALRDGAHGLVEWMRGRLLTGV
jgi:glutamate---cysteine ligase / carboxylate-amine ligase